MYSRYNARCAHMYSKYNARCAQCALRAQGLEVPQVRPSLRAVRKWRLCTDCGTQLCAQRATTCTHGRSAVYTDRGTQTCAQVCTDSGAQNPCAQVCTDRGTQACAQVCMDSGTQTSLPHQLHAPLILIVVQARKHARIVLYKLGQLHSTTSHASLPLTSCHQALFPLTTP